MSEKTTKNHNTQFLQNIHETPTTDFAKYKANVFENFPFYPMHWHEDMEIVRVKCGSACFCIDGTKYDATCGDVIVLRPFAMHSILNNGSDLIVEAIVFNVRLLTDADGRSLQYFAPLLHDKNAVPAKICPNDEYYSYFDECLSNVFSNTDQNKDALTCLNELFLQIYSNRLINTAQNLTEDKRCYTVKRALEYIYSEFANEIVVENLSKHCGYSEFYTMKLFKHFTDYSCVDYANNYRLTIAGRKLLGSDCGIAEIAKSIGFNNISYFNRQFKKLYGKTPREFRK